MQREWIFLQTKRRQAFVLGKDIPFSLYVVFVSISGKDTRKPNGSKLGLGIRSDIERWSAIDLLKPISAW